MSYMLMEMLPRYKKVCEPNCDSEYACIQVGRKTLNVIAFSVEIIISRVQSLHLIKKSKR